MRFTVVLKEAFLKLGTGNRLRSQAGSEKVGEGAGVLVGVRPGVSQHSPDRLTSSRLLPASRGSSPRPRDPTGAPAPGGAGRTGPLDNVDQIGATAGPVCSSAPSQAGISNHLFFFFFF